MELEVPKVYGASKLEQRITSAPASISLVSSDEIKRFGYRTLAEVLQSVQGFHVSYDRNYAFLGTRGISLGDFNSRVLLLVNGHRVNNNLTDGAAIGTDFILDIDLIDRVEIIRGPGSVLYGNNAIFGVINVITRQGQQLNGAELSGEYASFDTYRARATFGKLFESGVKMMLSGTYYDSSGVNELFYKEYNTPVQNNGVAQNMDADSFASFFVSLSYRDFSLEGAYIDREKVNPTAQYFTSFNDPQLRTDNGQAYATLKYAHSFPDVVDVSANVYYDWNSYEISYPNSTTVFQQQDVGEWWGTELQLNKQLWERHIFTLGAEYRGDFRQASRVYDQNTTYTDVQTNRRSYAVFFQGDVAVLTNLHLTGGVRYDQVGDFDPAINPRLALIYNPFTQSTLKAIYGSAFRAPNFSELSDPRFQNIKPEEITAYELVYEQQIGRQLRTSVSGFYNDMNDLIVFESGRFSNIDANTKGLELAVEGFWTNGVRGRISYTLQKSESQDTSLDLPDSPEQLVRFNLSVPIFRDKIFAGVEYQYTSERDSLHNTTDSAGQPVTVQGQGVEGYGTLNFTLYSRELIKNLEFSASIYNLLDQEYSDPATRFHKQDTLERDGRTFRVKLTYRF